MKNIIDLQLFGSGDVVLGTEGTVNANNGEMLAYTDGAGLSPEMKTY